jgi:hypothetical protein
MDKGDVLAASAAAADYDDWIRISIRFSGFCLYCKKRLNSGEYGYWSKSSKSIIHEPCFDALFSPNSHSDINDLPSIQTGLMNLDKTKEKTVGQEKKPGTMENNNTAHIKRNDNFGGGDSISNPIKKREKNAKCFICNNPVDFENDLIMSLLKLSSEYRNNSDILYCSDCLDDLDNDAYEKYKRKFMDFS